MNREASAWPPGAAPTLSRRACARDGYTVAGRAVPALRCPICGGGLRP